MKVLYLAGADKICREAAHDLVQFSDFQNITIADYNGKAGREVVKWLNDPRFDFKKVDVNSKKQTVNLMRQYHIVMDGTTISLNDRSTACIAQARCHGINLNGFGEEYKYDRQFKEHEKTHVPGVGMTPGTTNVLARYGADQMDRVDEIFISHGAFRAIAHSPWLASTTFLEYDPDL